MDAPRSMGVQRGRCGDNRDSRCRGHTEQWGYIGGRYGDNRESRCRDYADQGGTEGGGTATIERRGGGGGGCGGGGEERRRSRPIKSENHSQRFWKIPLYISF